MAVAVAYAPDVEIVDVEVPDFDPEGLTMQARANGSSWHRRLVGGSATACGLPLDFQQSLRHESYLGELCTDGCFTALELSISNRLNEAEKKAGY